MGREHDLSFEGRGRSVLWSRAGLVEREEELSFRVERDRGTEQDLPVGHTPDVGDQ